MIGKVIGNLIVKSIDDKSNDKALVYKCYCNRCHKESSIKLKVLQQAIAVSTKEKDYERRCRYCKNMFFSHDEAVELYKDFLNKTTKKDLAVKYKTSVTTVTKAIRMVMEELGEVASYGRTIAKYDLDGKYITTYDNAFQASMHENANYAPIYKCVTGVIKMYKKHIYKYAADGDTSDIVVDDITKFYLIDITDGNLITVFNTIADIAVYFKKNHSTVRHYVNARVLINKHLALIKAKSKKDFDNRFKQSINALLKRSKRIRVFKKGTLFKIYPSILAMRKAFKVTNYEIVSALDSGELFKNKYTVHRECYIEYKDDIYKITQQGQ